MATTLKQLLTACSFALAATALTATPASATVPDSHPKAKDVVKHKAKAKARKAEAQATPALQEDPEPDITDTVSTEYNCELGNKITIYTNDKDDAHIALRWKKRLHRLTRVGTTTGALRFENTSFGLVWIGIPSKGILLDSKLNRQLANECKNAAQVKSAAADGLLEKKS
jgi:membrane-bound inhibitor of C-type lysozyme